MPAYDTGRHGSFDFWGKAMRSWIFFLGVALLPWQAASAADFEGTFVVGADIDVQGHVVGIQAGNDLAPAIVSALNQSLTKWSFEPVQRDGAFVQVHSFITAKVAATETGAGTYAVRVSYVGVGPKWIRPTTKPERPLSCGPCVSAFATTVDVDATGRPKVTSIAGSLYDGHQDIEAIMEKNVVTWIEQGSFVNEQIDGKGIGFQTNLPVTFRSGIPDIEFNGHRRTYGCEDMATHKVIDTLDPRCNPYLGFERAFLGPKGYRYYDGVEHPPVDPTVLKPRMVDAITL
jgi:hypothetical protein